GEPVARHPVAVQVVAHALRVAETAAPVAGALPPAGDVGSIRAAVASVLDLAAERRIAVGAEARPAAAWSDHRPRGLRPDEVTDGRHGKRRTRKRRTRERSAAREPPLEQRAHARRKSLA